MIIDIRCNIRKQFAADPISCFIKNDDVYRHIIFHKKCADRVDCNLQRLSFRIAVNSGRNQWKCYGFTMVEFIEKAKDEVVISLAHTASDYDTAKEAIQRGASHATHLYNAMPPLNHRNPGVIGAVRDFETCHAELICDGVHIHPSVIRATFAMFGAKRMILISDSMRATGLNDGDYTLGGQLVKVKGNLATLHDGTIAGSATNLMDCVRFVVKKVGLPFETAVMCASENPAKEIGIFHEVGSISAGKKADFVLLDKDLNIVSVYVDGKEITC